MAQLVDDAYDFIIVGGKQFPDYSRMHLSFVTGGTAGNVVAGRLAENPEIKILVREAVAGFVPNPSLHVFQTDTRQETQTRFQKSPLRRERSNCDTASMIGASRQPSSTKQTINAWRSPTHEARSSAEATA